MRTTILAISLLAILSACSRAPSPGAPSLTATFQSSVASAVAQTLTAMSPSTPPAPQTEGPLVPAPLPWRRLPAYLARP